MKNQENSTATGATQDCNKILEEHLTDKAKWTRLFQEMFEQNASPLIQHGQPHAHVHGVCLSQFLQLIITRRHDEIIFWYIYDIDWLHALSSVIFS